MKAKIKKEVVFTQIIGKPQKVISISVDSLPRLLQGEQAVPIKNLEFMRKAITKREAMRKANKCVFRCDFVVNWLSCF